MIIENMFKQDINRPINGVIQVNQEDPECIKQELSEYVITKGSKEGMLMLIKLEPVSQE